MRKILIIEDESNIRETLSDLLSMHQYETIEAENGREGVQKALTESPDIILCDVNMPDMDGYQVLSELRKKEALTYIPFIFLTAKSSMEELRHGMILGADDYMVKPFDQALLLQSIRTAEEKKLAIIDRQNALQNKLNIEKLKLEDINHLNSHEIRRKLSVIQSLLPMIKNGDLTMANGMKLIEESGKDLDATIHKINDLIHKHSEALTNSKSANLDDVGTIWLIDDDKSQNIIMTLLLRKVNPAWSVHSFENPIKALEKLSINVPDVIFLDINMPQMNGFGFLEELEKLQLDLQVIMVSSSISPADIAKSLSYPAIINYITKPVTNEELERLLVHH